MSSVSIRPFIDRLAGQFFTFIKHYARAVRHYEAAVAAQPHWGEVWARLGYLYQTEGRSAEAIAALERALALTPDDAATQFNLGFILQQGNAPDAALPHLELAARLNPQLDRAWYGIGIIRSGRGEFDLAVPALEQAARLQPFNGLASYHLCIAYAKCSRKEALMTEFRRIRQYDPPTARRLQKDLDLQA